MAVRGVPLSTLCPKFLHTNSTSHTWPFSAIAELIDNAVDPDVNAKHFWIDKTVVEGKECLIFMDSGNGLNNETMHKMLSFGYSDKTTIKGIKPIGMYGNGFKSGAMRLGKDAIVFSKSKSSSCVGMLSQTYLQTIKAEQIVVPIVCFEQSEEGHISVRDEQQASLRDILTHSPYKTEAELLVEIEAISSPWSTSKTGTRVVIWNLRRTSEDKSEFDFEVDRYDIRIPTEVYESMNEKDPQPGRAASHVPASCYSLRAYCKILYLKPRMQIIIRGQKVKSELIAKSLAFVVKDSYKPLFLNHKPIPITFGYNTKSKDQYGVMMYHKNRLIKAYERVGCQHKANKIGVGVIGIIECGLFLEPTHNKQSFNETDKYRKTMSTLGIKLEEYWREIRHKRQTEDPSNSVPIEDRSKRPDQNWVQCDDCSRWRKLPDGINPDKLPDQWFCQLNPDPQFRSCQVEEEPEDSDDDQPTYRKTYKQHEKVLKSNQERKRRKEVEEQKRQEQQRLLELAQQNQALKQQTENLQRKLQQQETIAHSPSKPPNLRRRLNAGSPHGAAATDTSPLVRSSTVSQAACSSPGNSGLPVILNVCSLSTPLLRSKRSQPSTPQTTPKRPKTNGFRHRTPDTSTTADVSPQNSPSVPLLSNDDSDETDDDILIVENVSTPKPNKQGFDLAKVKEEQKQRDVNVGMLLECSDDAALDDATKTNDVRTSSVAVGPNALPGLSSVTTQTDVAKVKTEAEDPNQFEEGDVASPSMLDIKDEEQSEDMQVDVCNKETNRQNNANDAALSRADICAEEAQKQQDQLVELMQSTAQERDHFKEQVQKLTCQLKDMQGRLQELTQTSVKKESSHQAVQTVENEEGDSYKNLFEKAKQKVDELIREKNSLLEAPETKPSTSHSEERDLDEIALQVDSLLRELDHRNKERDELRSQLDSLEGERANLASQCEELRISLQQEKENAQLRDIPPHPATDSSAQTDGEETNSTPDAYKSLIELRHNIGRLLLSYVPALDLEQVNYECNVIDEILEQVVCDESGPIAHGELSERSINT